MGFKIKTTITVILLVMITGCTILKRVVYQPNINQGNYLTTSDIMRLHIGMTKQQVVYILGTPMISNPFGSNVWYYVCRQQSSHEKVYQQTLSLSFDSDNLLINIDNKFDLSGNYTKR